MDAWFKAFTSKFETRNARSVNPAASVEEYIATHEGLPAKLPQPRQGEIWRDDVRSSGDYAGPRFNLPSEDVQTVDIFGDRTLHEQAAATFASLAQKKSGFSPTAANIVESFQQYLDDFVQVHWQLLRSKVHQVQHSQQNHAKFLQDLVEIVTDELKALQAGESTIDTIAGDIKKLAQRVGASSNSFESTTLYDATTIAKEGQDVIFTIFFVNLQMKHSQSAKSEVLSTQATTYSVIMALNSSLVLQYADAYNKLTKASVDDYISEHSFPNPITYVSRSQQSRVVS